MLFKSVGFNMSKKQTLLIFFILYLFTLGIRIYWLSQKNDIHIDESFSVQLTCRNDWNYESNRGYTGKEAKEVALLCRNNALEDIYHLWQDNRDPPHTNLYYSLFRLSLAGLDSVDMQQIILRGGILNLFFFTTSFIFFFLLARLLFPESPLLQLTATACAFLSTAAISNTLFLRPYQIQETSFIVFCYYFFKTFDQEKYAVPNDQACVNVRLLVLLSLATAFALLTGYFSLFFVGLFGLYAIYHKVKAGRSLDILFYTATLFLAMLFAQIFYLKYLYGYFSIRATDQGQRLTDHLFSKATPLEDIKNALVLVKEFVLNHFFTYPVLIICALCLLFVIISRRRRFLKQKHAFYIFAASILYAIVIMYLAPFKEYKEIRYIMPVFPSFVLLPTSIIYSMGKRKIAAVAMALLCVFFALNAFKKSNIKYLVNSDEYIFNRESGVPVFIFNKTPWKYSELVRWFNDEQVYYFNTPVNIAVNDPRGVYLVFEKTHEMLHNLKLSRDEIEQSFASAFFVGIKIRLQKQ